MSRCHVCLLRTLAEGPEIRYVVKDLDTLRSRLSDLDSLWDVVMDELAYLVIRADRRDASVLPIGRWKGNPEVASVKEAADALWGKDGSRERFERLVPFGSRSMINLIAAASEMLEKGSFPAESPSLNENGSSA